MASKAATHDPALALLPVIDSDRSGLQFSSRIPTDHLRKGVELSVGSLVDATASWPESASAKNTAANRSQERMMRLRAAKI